MGHFSLGYIFTKLRKTEGKGREEKEYDLSYGTLTNTKNN